MIVDRAPGYDRKGSSHEITIYRVFVSISRDTRNHNDIELYYRLTALV